MGAQTTEDKPLWEQAGMEPDDQAFIESYIELKQANMEGSKRLAQQGRMIDPSLVLLNRIDRILDSLFGDDNKARMTFEYQFEVWVNQQLQASLSEVSRSKLLEGVPGLG